MKILSVQFSAIIALGCLGLSVAPLMAQSQTATNNPGYTQSNLVSDLATNAPHTDPRLVNPWGFVVTSGTVVVNDNGTGLTTAYSPAGHASRFLIHIPAPGGGQGTPTGLVLNDTRQFAVSSGGSSAPSILLMATEDGTIAAWNDRVTGSNAVIVVDNSGSGAVYKGLAIARDTNSAPMIFAANFHAGTVDVFDGQFHSAGSFTDSTVPQGFAPFNVERILGRLFVTFALQKLPDAHDDQAGAGNGFVDIFDTDGTLLRRFASQGPLNSPWGMAVAPGRFGRFSQALLVGNFGDGMINAFDLLTGKLLGHLTRANGDDLVIDGLWGLAFDRPGPFEDGRLFRAERLFFTAGINSEADGLFGFIRPVNPSTTPAR